LKNLLHVLVAESPRQRFLRERILPRRRIRLAGSAQECIDLAHAGSADVMVVDLDNREFSDPDFIRRVRFASRGAFPILGVAARDRVAGERWSRRGLSDLLVREDLTAERLDRALRHWVRYRRLQRRVFDADRRALAWWKNLVDALDEVRRRLEQGSDALNAYLGLLEGGEGGVEDLRRRHVAAARRQVNGLERIAADLDVAARTIQLRGLERSEREARCRRPAVRPEEWLADADEDEAGVRSIDRPHPGDAETEQRRFGT